jgi:hypothetical protein
MSSCAPAALNTPAAQGLAAALARQPKTPSKVLQDLTALLVTMPYRGHALEAALAICCHPNVHHQNIHDLLGAKGANSDFRNELWQRSSHPEVRALLKLIKDRHAAQAPAAAPASQPPVPAATEAPPLDARLIGRWTWSSASASSLGYSAMSIASVSVHESFVFFADGRFIRSSNSFAGLSGATAQLAFARTDAADRGHWCVRGKALHLDWDDQMTSDVDYFIAHGTLELR